MMWGYSKIHANVGFSLVLYLSHLCSNECLEDLYEIANERHGVKMILQRRWRKERKREREREKEREGERKEMDEWRMHAMTGDNEKRWAVYLEVSGIKTGMRQWKMDQVIGREIEEETQNIWQSNWHPTKGRQTDWLGILSQYKFLWYRKQEGNGRKPIYLWRIERCRQESSYLCHLFLSSRSLELRRRRGQNVQWQIFLRYFSSSRAFFGKNERGLYRDHSLFLFSLPVSGQMAFGYGF